MCYPWNPRGANLLPGNTTGKTGDHGDWTEFYVLNVYVPFSGPYTCSKPLVASIPSCDLLYLSSHMIPSLPSRSSNGNESKQCTVLDVRSQSSLVLFIRQTSFILSVVKLSMSLRSRSYSFQPCAGYVGVKATTNPQAPWSLRLQTLRGLLHREGYRCSCKYLSACSLTCNHVGKSCSVGAYGQDKSHTLERSGCIKYAHECHA